MKKQIIITLSLLLVSCIYCSRTTNKSSAQTQEDIPVPVFTQPTKLKEIPENIAYEQFFQMINSFEREARKQESEGFLSRAENLRNTFKKILQLNNQQFSKIKKAAGNFTSILFRLRLKAKQINQSKSAKAKKQTRIKEIEDEYNQLPMIYREDLRKDFGEKDFERFDKSFQEKISARMSYRSNIRKQLLFTGFSTVSYDSVSGEIIGYSKTPNDGTDCDSEENTDCVGTSVYAVLSSDREGVLDSDSSEDCNSDSEVFLYSSGSLPEASYCVNGYHGYDDSSFCSFQGGGSVFTSEDCLTTPPAPNVATITFQPIAQNNLPIDEINGGLRIFPDDNSPMENANRQTIRVSASISEARAGQMVYFRSFDIDDPSTDLTIDPNGNLGDDNNGSVNNLKEGQLLIPAGSGGCQTFSGGISCPTNSNGTAVVNFTVTMQPGDNFAIAASLDPSQVSAGVINVSGIELLNGSGQNIPTTCDETAPVCRSQMLTVWRRLHIEVDSMGAAQGNFVAGATSANARIKPYQAVPIDVTSTLEPNRFEGGRVEFTNGNSFPVVSNSANTITVENTTGSTFNIGSGTQFQLFDDDDFNDDDGTNVDGDTGEDIPPPDMSLLTANSDDVNMNVFAAAYVRPVYDIADTRDNGIFQANVNSDAAADIRPLFVDWDSSGTNKAVEFWSIYLLGSYQHTLGTDNDPTTEPCPGRPGFHCVVFGIVDEITNVTGPPGDMEGSGALIFTELHRAKERAGYNPNPTSLNSMAVTVAHEAAHLFSCRHGDGGLMGTDPNTGTPVTNQLSPTMIFKIRGLMHP